MNSLSLVKMTFIFYSYSPSGECSLDKIRCHPLCVCVCVCVCVCIIIQLVISLYMNCLITCVSCCSISMILTLNFSLYFSEKPQGKNGKCFKNLLLINLFYTTDFLRSRHSKSLNHHAFLCLVFFWNVYLSTCNFLL